MRINKVLAKLTFLLILCALPCVVNARILGIAGEDHSSIGIFIKDLKADTVVLSYNADRCHTPASITKSYTVASAMSILGEDFRFETKVFLTGSKGDNGVWNGNLVVKASGDPTLDSDHFPKNRGFIKKIIDALAENGISRINGDIILARVDESHQYEEGPIDTWCINDVAWGYGCGVFDFNWSDNVFGLYPATGATTVSIPTLRYKVWTNTWRSGLDIIRGVYSDSLIIGGKAYATDKKARVNTTMPYPFNAFRATLADRLKKAGIEITLKASGATDRNTLLVSHKSPALDEILRSLMLRSDNMFAEGMLRVLGNNYGDRNESLASETFVWKSRGLLPQYNRILDGSGLSRANAISPRFMADMLEWMAKSSYKKRYLSFFPVAGVSGTLKSFMADTPLKGRLAMKTGSVNAVQTYAGYLTDASGEPTHVIVFMANNFFCSRSDLREAWAKLLLKKLKPFINR